MAYQFDIKILCPQCSYSSDQFVDLLQHIQQQHDKPAESSPLATFKCLQCEYNTQDSAEYNQHVYEHLPVLICTFCDFKCYDAAAMEEHISSIHNSKLIIQEDFSCSICHLKIPSQALLNIHYTRCHPTPNQKDITVKQYVCRLCFFTTPFKTDFTLHKRSVHLDKCFKCPECLYVATYKSNLQLHLKKFHKISKILCDLCDWAGNNQAKLNQHKKVNHNFTNTNVYLCYRCEYSVSDKEKLLDHISLHNHQN
jgi:KRAB domain-containing zinc finger protein